MKHDYAAAEELLKQEDPLWFKLVNLETLNMRRGNYCVCGQVMKGKTLEFKSGYDTFINKYNLDTEQEIRMGIAGLTCNDWRAIQRRWKNRTRKLQKAQQ